MERHGGGETADGASECESELGRADAASPPLHSCAKRRSERAPGRMSRARTHTHILTHTQVKEWEQDVDFMQSLRELEKQAEGGSEGARE